MTFVWVGSHAFKKKMKQKRNNLLHYKYFCFKSFYITTKKTKDSLCFLFILFTSLYNLIYFRCEEVAERHFSSVKCSIFLQCIPFQLTCLYSNIVCVCVCVWLCINPVYTKEKQKILCMLTDKEPSQRKDVLCIRTFMYNCLLFLFPRSTLTWSGNTC